MARGQKRGSDGRYKEMPKASRVVATPSPAKVRTPLIDVAKPAGKGTTRSQAPTGHIADGVRTIHEYVERVRIVYAAFVRRNLA